MNIGDAARESGVPVKTIRYYEETGLIKPALRAANGYRRYAVSDVLTLRFIHSARRLGFTVKDVGNLLSLWQYKNRASKDVLALALRHVKKVEERIAELEAIRRTLLHLTERCHGDDRPGCPILEGIAKPD